MRITYTTRQNGGEWETTTTESICSGIDVYLSDDDAYPRLSVELESDGNVRISMETMGGPSTLAVVPNSANSVTLRLI